MTQRRAPSGDHEIISLAGVVCFCCGIVYASMVSGVLSEICGCVGSIRQIQFVSTIQQQ